MREDLIELAKQQAAEIARAGHNGWGNTMLALAVALESSVPVGVEGLVREYRKSMDVEVLHAWAQDVVRALTQKPDAVGVRGLPRYGFPDGNEPRPVPCTDGYWTPWHLAQALRNEAHATAAKDAEIERLKVVAHGFVDEIAAGETKIEALQEQLDWTVKQNDTLLDEGRKLTARAERLAEALREAQPFIGWAGSYEELHAKIDALLRDQEEGT